MLSPERFAEVCTATKWNLRSALDLIAIHSEAEVRGRQPRASLNPFTVLAAAAAWERLVSDLVAAASFTHDKWNELGTGHFQLPKGKNGPSPAWDPAYLDSYLTSRNVITGRVTDEWNAYLSADWTGATPKKWSFVRYVDDPETFELALNNARHVRNGAAHFALPQSARKSLTVGYSWRSDAEADTIQAGHARATAALFLQIIDCTIMAVAWDHGWNAGRFQPPTNWFMDVVPESDRRYPGVKFWGGRSLLRA